MTGPTAEPTRYPLPDGRKIACTHENDPLAWSGLLEDSPYDDGLAGLRPGDTIVDVGAHIGLTSLYFALRAPGVRLVACEPAPATYACLADNLSRLLPDAVALHTAVGARSGTAELTIYPNHTMMATLQVDERDDATNMTAILDNWHVDEPARESFWDQFRAGTHRVAVPVTTLSELIDRHRLARVDLLKIDVERSELAVLDGIRAEHWPRIRQLTVEVHDIDGRLDAVRRLLTDRGFDTREFQEPLFTGGSVHIVFAARPAVAADA